jgi:hypothetical protein
MKEPCWYELSIPCDNAINPNWKFPDVTGKEFGVWAFPAFEIFSREWIQYLNKRGITVTESLVFYREPGHNTHNAHLDIHRHHPVRISSFGLNMVVGGQDAPMTWYQLPADFKTTKPTAGDAGTIYYNWPINTLEEIDRHVLAENKLTMVRVGIPHTVIMKDQPRWCISARAGTIEKMYWKDITKWMRDHDFLIERDSDVL